MSQPATSRALVRLRELFDDDPPFQPNLVRVAYFETTDGMERMQEDLDHERLDKLYSAIVSDAVWVIGRVPPSQLTASDA